MKKIFTLIAAALLGGVASVNAQDKKFWDLTDWKEVTVTNGEITKDGLTYYGDSKSAFSDGNASIEADGETLNFTGRIKMGGASTFQEGKTLARVFSFEAKEGDVIYVFGTHGSSSGDPRTFYVSMAPSETKNDNTTAFGEKALEPSEKGYLKATAPSTGIVYLWADNNNGIYAISVGYTAAELAELQKATSIGSITTETANNAAAPIYNLAGQQVTKDYKGVCIQNGKKFINK